MKRNLASRVALIGLVAATCGCTSSAKRTALPEGTRFTAATDASSVAAARLLADGNYGLAIEMYRRILAATPDDPAAVEGLALCYDRLRRYDLSDVYFQKALALAPRNDAFYRAYAASLTAQGRQDAAALLDVDMRAMLASASATPAAPTPPSQPVAPPPITAPALASAAAVPVMPAPVIAAGPRLEQSAPGVVHLILPPERSAGRGVALAPPLTPVPLPAPSRVASPKPMATTPAPGALRNTMVVNAAGRKGIAGRVQSYLAGRGWRPLDRGDSGMRIAVSRILYPPSGEATARRLARAVPFPTRLYATTQANRIQLLVGGNALRFVTKPGGGRR
ncbi:LytR C-terminal domain-containing protein [Sphingomonas mali]|uniref:LytR C-terminal domain-containing protein n=1 Tax=Sphingomonas mali TaxID=40682 RepID=UPI0008377DFF|nr:LytR C-terminal domain-containing protein [Sphingomonas mali]